MHKAAFILLWVYVFTLPWDYILQFGDPIGSASRVAGLLALAGCVAWVATSWRMRRLHGFHIVTVIYLAVATLSLFWTANEQDSLRAVRTYAQSIMVVWMLWELGAERLRLFHFATAYIAGAWLAALSIFVSFSATNVAARAREARFGGDNWDVNDLALVLALAIPLAFYVANQRVHWVNTWLARGYLMLAPIAIVLTSSRAGIVVMAIAFSGLPSFLRRQTPVTKLVTVLMFVVAAYLAWNYAPQQSWNRIGTLVTSLRAGDLNSRELVWQNGLRAFHSHYLVGVGAGAFQAGAQSCFDAHNTFLAVLVEQGLVGFSMFSVLLGFVVYSVTRLRGDERMMCALLLLCWGVGVFTLGWAMNRATWFVLGFIVTCAHVAPDPPLLELESAGGMAEVAVGCT